MQSHNLSTLIKPNTYFNGSGSCIDLILKNQKFCFESTSSFETGLRNHHRLIYFILRTTFRKEDSKRLIYHDYKDLNNKYLENYLKNGLSECSKNHEQFENIFVLVLDRHAPRKIKILRGNQKPHVDTNLDTNLCKGILKR